MSGPSAAEQEPQAVDSAGPIVTEPSTLLADHRPTWRIVLALALPVVAQQFLVLFVGLSDRFLAGRLQPMDPHEQAEALGQCLLALGQQANQSLAGLVASEANWEAGRQIMARHLDYQAAQTTAVYLGWLIASFTVLVSVGSTALVARFMGGGDRQAAVRATNQSILLAVIIGLAATLAGLTWLHECVALLRLTGPAAGFAADYLRPMVLLLIFQVLESAGIACLIGAGDTRTGFYVLGGVAILNLPLAWGFFLGWGPMPELRFVGIALGTALSHTVGGVAVLCVLARGRAGLALHWRLLWPDWRLIARLLRVSVPAGIDSFFIMFGHLWFLSLVNTLGVTASSAHGIALGWESLSFLGGHAFGTAAMALVGQNLGAGRPREAARAGWTTFAIGGGVMTCMGITFYTFAPEMFLLFCPHPEQRPVIEVGVPVLRLEAFAEPALASIVIFLSALRGAGDTRVPVLINTLGLFGVRLPLGYLFTGWGWGLYGAWMAMVVDLFLRGGLFMARFASGRWQKVRV